MQIPSSGIGFYCWRLINICTCSVLEPHWLMRVMFEAQPPRLRLQDIYGTKLRIPNIPIKYLEDVALVGFSCHRCMSCSCGLVEQMLHLPLLVKLKARALIASVALEKG